MTAKKRIYLDHAATTPIISAAQQAIVTGFEKWANPSSPHFDGRAAQSMLEDARKRVQTALDWDGQVIFTSGASDSIAIALQQSKAQLKIVSPVEHDAVLRLTKDSLHINVNQNGLVDHDSLDRALSVCEEPALVIIQSVNNETGVMQDLDSVAAMISGHGAALLSDCAQSASKVPLPPADMIVIAGHKFGAPPGIGALLVKDIGLLNPLGGQEQGYRPGTQNLPYILGLAAALENSGNWLARADELRAQLDSAIAAEGGVIVAHGARRIATISSYQMPGVSANSQLIQFDMAGFSISAGSACSSGTLKSSHVLNAMGMAEEAAREVIRVSIGRDTTRSEIYSFIEQWKSIARIRSGLGRATR